jgi:hypothetical protein
MLNVLVMLFKMGVHSFTLWVGAVVLVACIGLRLAASLTKHVWSSRAMSVGGLPAMGQQLLDPAIELLSRPRCTDTTRGSTSRTYSSGCRDIRTIGSTNCCPISGRHADSSVNTGRLVAYGPSAVQTNVYNSAGGQAPRTHQPAAWSTDATMGPNQL